MDTQDFIYDIAIDEGLSAMEYRTLLDKVESLIEDAVEQSEGNTEPYDIHGDPKMKEVDDGFAADMEDLRNDR